MREQSPAGRDLAIESRVVDLPRASRQLPQNDVLFDLRGILGALWRNKFTIAAFTLLAAIIGGYYAFFVATPMYRSSSVIVMETQPTNIVDLEGVIAGQTGESTEINTELEVLQSRSLMGRVVDALDLTADPEFNAELREPGLMSRAKSWIKSDLVGWSPSAAPINNPNRTRDAVVSALQSHIRVQNRPQTYVFQITVNTTGAEKSALIANTMAESYIMGQLEEKFSAMEQATTWLSDRVAELQVQLEEAEAKRAEFSAAIDLVSPEALQALERQLKETRDRIEDAMVTRATTEARVNELRAAGDRPDQAQVADDSILTRVLPRTTYSSADRRTFDERFQAIVRAAEQAATRADQQLTALQTSEVQLSEQIAQQGEDLIQLQQLTREAEAIRLLYEYFLTRLNETAAQQGIQQADSRLLSGAVIPNEPAAPRKSLLVVIAALMGAFAGAAFAFLREARKTGYRTGKDLENQTGLFVLGQIPKVPARQRRRVLQYLKENPTSAAAEAYRNLRTSLTIADVDNPPKVILSTSSVPSEGKTTNALALTQSLAGLGRRVLIIEGDLRRRTYNQYFENLPKRGFVSVLAGEVSLGDVVFRPEGYPADVLPGETTNTNAADLFSSQSFGQLLEELRTVYDHIVIDMPPVLVVPDARIVARIVDAVVFTVRWDYTSPLQVDEALRLFQASGQEITGLILSQIDPKGMKRYGYGEGYGTYGSYGDGYYKG